MRPAAVGWGGPRVGEALARAPEPPRRRDGVTGQPWAADGAEMGDSLRHVPVTGLGHGRAPGESGPAEGAPTDSGQRAAVFPETRRASGPLPSPGTESGRPFKGRKA